uniref:Reverse transcriptase n=1 Tax=Rhipicephalus appendiculatus TaxID=34631 RepID=A0A131Z2I9_RHIAP
MSLGHCPWDRASLFRGQATGPVAIPASSWCPAGNVESACLKRLKGMKRSGVQSPHAQAPDLMAEAKCGMGLPPLCRLIGLARKINKIIRNTGVSRRSSQAEEKKASSDGASGPPGGGGNDADPPGATCFSCVFCGRSFATKRGLGVHVARAHKELKNLRQDTGSETGVAGPLRQSKAIESENSQTMQTVLGQASGRRTSVLEDRRDLKDEMETDSVPIWHDAGVATHTQEPAARRGSSRYYLRSREREVLRKVPLFVQGGHTEVPSSVTPTSVCPLADPPEGASNAPVGLVKGSVADGCGVLPDRSLDAVHVAVLEGAINIPVTVAGRSTLPSASSPTAGGAEGAGAVAWEATGARPKVFPAKVVERLSCSSQVGSEGSIPFGASFFTPSAVAPAPADTVSAPVDGVFSATDAGVETGGLLSVDIDGGAGGGFDVPVGVLVGALPSAGGALSSSSLSDSVPPALSPSGGSTDSGSGFVVVAASVAGKEPSDLLSSSSELGDAHPSSCRSLARGSTPSDVIAPSSNAPTVPRSSGAVRMQNATLSSSENPPVAAGSGRPLPRQLRELVSDSSDEAIPVHHTCKDCGRAFSSLVGLSQHRRHAHFNEYNADIVITRVKPRWSKEESFLLAKKEAELTRLGVRNINQKLHFFFKTRTFDSIKSHRRDPGYRHLVAELLGTAATARSQSRHASSSAEEATADESVDVRKACLEEISRLVSTACPRGYSAPRLWEIGKQLLDGRNIAMDLNNYIRNNFYKDKRNPSRQNGPRIMACSNRKKRRQEYAQLQQMFKKDQARAAKQVLDGQLSCQVEDPDAFLQEWKGVMESRCEEAQLSFPNTATHPNRNPMRPITAQDIKYAFPAVSSSPGPDGFTAKELKSVPVVVLQLLLNILLVQKRLPVSLCSARTVFIPKVDGATSPSQFRPITVAPVLLRLLHKVLANRLQAMALLDCRQRAFVPVDGCGENVHLLGTILHEARRKRRALYMASVDIAKAFDSVTLDALLVALARKGIAEEFREYVRQFYEMASTVLTFQDNTLLVRPSRGVRQGDPLSPILFNLVVDEFLAEHCKEQIAFMCATESGELNVSGMAFADDLLLFASTPAGLQYKLHSLQIFLRARGLALNPSKCLSLAMVPAGKEKLVKVDPSVRFCVNNEFIPAAEGETTWRYLGISFSARGTLQKPIHRELKGYLDNVTKAALKPQQRLVVLRFYLLPRLYHRLILGPVSRKTLLRLDKTIRASVRNWLRLPHDVPIGAFHARIPDGGLGIPNLRTAIPYLRVRRLDALSISEYKACKKAHKMSYVQELLRQSQAMLHFKGKVIDSKKSYKKFWTSYFHGSTDGAALKEAANAPGSSAWLAEGTRFLSGREFINAVRVRFNTVPTLMRLKRGQDVTKLCRAGCDQDETLGHILQRCHRTHHTRIQRHDAIVRYAAKRCRELGFNVLEEPHYRTRQGTRIPDLVLKRDGQALVLDAQVVGGRVKLSDAHVTKSSKYMHHELCALVSRDVRPIVSTITISFRGVWAKESVDTLRDLGFIANDFKIMTIRCLQGGWRGFTVHQRMTTASSGRSGGRGDTHHTGT